MFLPVLTHPATVRVAQLVAGTVIVTATGALTQLAILRATRGKAKPAPAAAPEFTTRSFQDFQLQFIKAIARPGESVEETLARPDTLVALRAMTAAIDAKHPQPAVAPPMAAVTPPAPRPATPRRAQPKAHRAPRKRAA